MNTKRAIKSFLEAKTDKSPRTIRQYSDALAHLARECHEMPEIPGPVRLALNLAPTPWVKGVWWRVWHCFFRWSSREWDLINPMDRIDRPKLPEVELQPLSPQELSQLLAAAGDLQEKAVLALALDCGVRADEFGRIHVVDVGQELIRLCGKGNRQLTVPMSEESRALLQVLINRNGDRRPQALVFLDNDGRPLSRFSVYRIVRCCMKKAGISGPKLGPHRLRHSLGANFIANGGDAFTLKRVMRHKSLSTTMKYVNLNMQTVVEQHAMHSPLRTALRGSQGVLIRRDIEEVTGKADAKYPTSMEVTNG